MPSGTTPVDNRKDLMLLVLAANEAESVVGVTRMQKYLFLLQEEYGWHREFGIADPYKFRAYDYGPFDAQIYDDLQFLENIGFVRTEASGASTRADQDEFRGATDDAGLTDPEVRPADESPRTIVYSLTDEGRKFADGFVLDGEHRRVLDDMKRKWNSRPLRKMLSWLYATYPTYAANTVLHDIKP